MFAENALSRTSQADQRGEEVQRLEGNALHEGREVVQELFVDRGDAGGIEEGGQGADGSGFAGGVLR